MTQKTYYHFARGIIPPFVQALGTTIKSSRNTGKIINDELIILSVLFVVFVQLTYKLMKLLHFS
ncbi:MAG TPA: hypothetical protein VMW67_07625 [Desulfobacteria bacterium]|nr:hypothetical protein [Desulfobacteria bacterium]